MSNIQTYAASDGYPLHYRAYRSEGEPRANLVCLHGIQSHGGWYEYSSQRLSQAGYNVFYLDRRGSGLNRADRGDTPSFRRLLDDLDDFIRTLPAADAASTPVVLIGTSWGGKLAVGYCRRHPGRCDGLVLLCPGICPQIRPPLGQRLRIAVARLLRPTRLFDIPLNDPALFTANEEKRRFIAQDDLSLRQATARFLVESFRLDAYLRFAAKAVDVPTLLMLAGHDRIIDNARTRDFVARFASGDKEIIEYADAHHTLEFEPNPDRFIDDLIAWLESRQEKMVQRRGRRASVKPA